LCLCFVISNLSADVAIVTFENPIPSAPEECFDTWSENGVDMTMVEVMGGGSCFFEYTGVGELWLFPSGFSLDLSPFPNINQIQITYTDFCGNGCTSGTITDFAGNVVFSYGNSVIGSQETTIFDNFGGDPLSELFAQSFEGQLSEIVIVFNEDECIEIGDSDGDGVCDDIDCEPFDPDIYPGGPCDDGDPCTFDDTWFLNDGFECDCFGFLLDEVCCEEEGLPCDDFDPCTVNDVYDEFCECYGIFLDSDGDEVCDAFDCDPNNPEIYPGAPCDDGDPCTEDDTWFYDEPQARDGEDAQARGMEEENFCVCIGTPIPDNDEDGYCGEEDPDDNNPCVPDEESPNCITFTICDEADNNDFEDGYGGWIDGGADCAVSSFPTYAFSGEDCLRLRDNSNSSTLTSPSYDLSIAEEVMISFTYVANSFDNANEDFWLEMSTNDGPFELIEEWSEGDEFENEIREFVDLTIPGPFSDDIRFRLKCDASSNADRVYIDDIVIEYCYEIAPPSCNDGIQNGDEEGIDCGGSCGPCPCEDFDFNDFEAGLGIWNDGGADAFLLDAANVASSGSFTVRLRDNTNSSVITTNDIDASLYQSAQISFGYFPSSFDSPDEDFWLQVSTDGGATFTTVEEWNYTDEFVNDEFYSDLVNIDGPFTATTQFRFRCDASSNADRVFLDDILIEFCDGEAVMANIFVMTTGFSNQVANYYSDFTDHNVVTGGVTATDLTDKDLVFLPLPESTFSTEAEADLAAYLSTGGRIVAIGCPCIGGSIPVINSLLANLGSSQSLNDEFVDPGGCSIESGLQNTDNSIVGGLVEIGIGCYTSINPGSGDILMTNANGVNMMSIESVGGGEIVLLNDIDYFYDCFIDETIVLAEGLLNPYIVPTGNVVDTEMGDFALSRSFESDIEFVAYPNPVIQGEPLFMEIENPEEGMSYEILDQTGRIISKAVWNADYEMVELQTDDFATGQYLIKLNTNDGIMTKKFMIISN